MIRVQDNPLKRYLLAEHLKARTVKLYREEAMKYEVPYSCSAIQRSLTDAFEAIDRELEI
jgi:hypothetical protein